MKLLKNEKLSKEGLQDLNNPGKGLKTHFSKKILIAITFLLFAQYALAHTDEIGEADSMHFMHYGSLTFPVWTYWAEILEHSGMIIAGIIVFIVLLNHYSSSADKTKRKNIAYALWGFGLWTLGEILTQSHHFLFFPFGIFNAVVTHGLTLAGIILIIISIAKICSSNQIK